MKFTELIEEIQVTDNEVAWQKMLDKLEPLINSLSRYVPSQYRDDLRQVLYIEVIRVVRSFKLEK
ncbi:helix-turn-helix domain-containing protein [Clostridium sp. 'deep sea']|uniref:helix-turn-helix domain-containing protein n=1 Tax=Clostridium sp. 'deep sea' TaxID=2779445 RepID=UPI00189697AD|nr:helix-turn-helix domain-containing protein [Clostridium sp. 'deep sea']QOR35633.1 helix-turn-helix domain-containing protein [Clostridium sp. 'deep sea']